MWKRVPRAISLEARASPAPPAHGVVGFHVNAALGSVEATPPTDYQRFSFAPPAEQESRSALRHRHEHAKHAHDMHWRMSARAGCRVRYKLRPLAPIAASPRALCHPRTPGVRRLLMRANPGKALLLSALADLHGSFNGNWFGTGCSPELRTGPVKVKSAAVARSFALRLCLCYVL